VLLALSARVAGDDGDVADASRLVRQAYEVAVGTRDMPIVATVGVALADLADDPAEAAVLLGAAARLRGADDRTAVEIARVTSDLVAVLGDERFATLYADGKALERDAAIERLGRH
jgi:hypothetical protein